MTDDRIKSLCYTKDEVDKMISDAVAEARAIDEASMAKHNRDATVISMILGFTALALFVDGLLRMLGIIEPFMGILGNCHYICCCRANLSWYFLPCYGKING